MKRIIAYIIGILITLAAVNAQETVLSAFEQSVHLKKHLRKQYP